MKDLLKELQEETFIFDVDQDVSSAFSLDGYRSNVVDNRTLEINVKKGQGLNDIFAALTDKGLKVLSMRNKANRLEELFVRLVEGGNA